jgi:PadR family transcriptional regulator, regulatory protein PadR
VAGETVMQYLRGTLDVLVLRTLQGGPLHGYGVATRIDGRTGGVLRIEDGALYQALHRLEARGLVESSWGHAESGKRARFYRLTAEGERKLEADVAGWHAYVAAVAAVLRQAPVQGGT